MNRVALVLVVALASCSSGASTPNATPSQTPSTGAGAASDRALPTDSPTPRTDFPPLEDPNDPVLIAYCSAQDRVVTLEGRLLSQHLSEARSVRALRGAQRAAGLTVGVFRRAHEAELERLAQRWTDAFDSAVARIRTGRAPIDAMTPAIRALGAIERRFSCELDG